jgi:hypothetical protein
MFEFFVRLCYGANFVSGGSVWVFRYVRMRDQNVPPLLMIRSI